MCWRGLGGGREGEGPCREGGTAVGGGFGFLTFSKETVTGKFIVSSTDAHLALHDLLLLLQIPHDTVKTKVA